MAKKNNVIISNMKKKWELISKQYLIRK